MPNNYYFIREVTFTIINFIKQLIDFEDDNENIIITNFRVENSHKIICVEYKNSKIYCPKCGTRMRVKEKYVRHIKHSILQDGFQLIIEYTQRSWTCPSCKDRFTPNVHFVSKYKQFSNATTYLSVIKLEDLSLSVSSVASSFGMSDTSLHNLFLQHIDMQRLPLPEVLSIDEVYINMAEDCKYALVLMDFMTHDIIDILPSRRETYTNQYFLDIPSEERKRVKYIISDMYEPYLAYINRYFYNASLAIDSFHVISWLINRINVYLRRLTNKYKDNKNSDEYYLLKNYKWLILKNEENIQYIDTPDKMDRHFHRLMPTILYLKRLYKIDPNLENIKELKEAYISFNNAQYSSQEEISNELDKLINTYTNSNIDMFVEFASLLKKHKDPILNSFVIMPSLGKSVRLSNGAMESFNRKPKDLKRLARGVVNFEFFRQRILFHERTEKPFLNSAKPLEDIKVKTNKKRGKYNTK